MRWNKFSCVENTFKACQPVAVRYQFNNQLVTTTFKNFYTLECHSDTFFVVCGRYRIIPPGVALHTDSQRDIRRVRKHTIILFTVMKTIPMNYANSITS